MVILLVLAGLLIGGLTYAFTRHGPGVGKGTGRSIRRGVGSHYTADGRPKHSYASIEAARSAAGRQGLSAYRCRECGQFHLGH